MSDEASAAWARAETPVAVLPTGLTSLARISAPALPIDTLLVLAENGGLRVLPEAQFTLRFGRDDVESSHVSLGRDDAEISRQHGYLRYDDRRWRLHNTGHLPIRLPGGDLLLRGHSESLPRAYWPLFIRTGTGREHLVEVRVLRPEVIVRSSEAQHGTTRVPAVHVLDPSDRLILTALGQRYLRQEPNPQPLAWADVLDELVRVCPRQHWTTRIVQHRVRAIRLDLARKGTRGLLEAEVPPPLGNTLNHNLIMTLLATASLVPPDLRLLDGRRD